MGGKLQEKITWVYDRFHLTGEMYLANITVNNAVEIQLMRPDHIKRNGQSFGIMIYLVFDENPNLHNKFKQNLLSSSFFERNDWDGIPIYHSNYDLSIDQISNIVIKLLLEVYKVKKSDSIEIEVWDDSHNIVLSDTLDIFQEVTKVEMLRSEVVDCHGCGAPLDSNVCEYCGRLA
jgi:hypothetical protein